MKLVVAFSFAFFLCAIMIIFGFFLNVVWLFLALHYLAILNQIRIRPKHDLVTFMDFPSLLPGDWFRYSFCVAFGCNTYSRGPMCFLGKGASQKTVQNACIYVAENWSLRSYFPARNTSLWQNWFPYKRRSLGSRYCEMKVVIISNVLVWLILHTY